MKGPEKRSIGNNGGDRIRTMFSLFTIKMNQSERYFLSVLQGEMLGVIGATGSGKDNIGGAVMRLVDVDQGRIDTRTGYPSKAWKRATEKVWGCFPNDIIFEGFYFENG